MKPSVKLLGGIHITATDKRRAIECLEYLTKRTGLAAQHPWLGVKGGKQYCIASHRDGIEGEYTLAIKERYKTDHGQTRERLTSLIIKVIGMYCPHIKPMGEPEPEQLQLFA